MKNNNSFQKRIFSLSTGKITLIALIIFLIFSATVLPDQSAKAEVYAGDAGSPDLSLFYSPADLYRMAEQFGPQGRQAYIKARFTFDFAFPLVYGVFLLTSIAWLLKRVTSEGSPWRFLVHFPLLGVLFDLLENTTASIVIGHFPNNSPFAATLAPFFTFIKWIFVDGSFIALFILLIFFIINQLKK